MRLPTETFGKKIVWTAALFAVSACSSEVLETSINKSAEDQMPVVRVTGAAELALSRDLVAYELSVLPLRARQAMTEHSQTKFLESLVLKELVLSQGLLDGLDRDPQVHAEMHRFRRDLIHRRALANLRDGIEVSDGEVEDYYRQNQKSYETKKVRVRQILLSDSAEARDVRLQALRAPESFSDLAKKYSVDASSAMMGGDLGFFGRGKMTPDFEKAAFGLNEPLEISEVVVSPYGFHILQLIEFREGRQRTLDQVAVQIRGMLLRRKRELAQSEFYASLRKSANISIDREAFSEELARSLEQGPVRNSRGSAH